MTLRAEQVQVGGQLPRHSFVDIQMVSSILKLRETKIGSSFLPSSSPPFLITFLYIHTSDELRIRYKVT